MLETIVLEWSLDMCIILILASTEDLNEKRRLEFNEDMKAKYWCEIMRSSN